MADHREGPNETELEVLKGLMHASEEDLTRTQETVSSWLIHFSIEDLDTAATRLGNLYAMAENHTYGSDYSFRSRCVDPFARALLETLTEQEDEARATNIAYQIVRHAALAQNCRDTGLRNVGMAARCEFPPHLGQPDRMTVS